MFHGAIQCLVKATDNTEWWQAVAGGWMMQEATWEDQDTTVPLPGYSLSRALSTGWASANLACSSSFSLRILWGSLGPWAVAAPLSPRLIALTLSYFTIIIWSQCLAVAQVTAQTSLTSWPPCSFAWLLESWEADLVPGAEEMSSAASPGHPRILESLEEKHPQLDSWAGTSFSTQRLTQIHSIPPTPHTLWFLQTHGNAWGKYSPAVTTPTGTSLLPAGPTTYPLESMCALTHTGSTYSQIYNPAVHTLSSWATAWTEIHKRNTHSLSVCARG